MICKTYNGCARVVSAHILFFCLLCAMLMGLHILGVTSRKYVENRKVYSVTAPEEALLLWNDSGIKGRVLFYFSRHLDVQISNETLEAFLMSKVIPSEINAVNYIPIAIEQNIIRKIYHVIPDDQWNAVSEKVNNIKEVRSAGNSYRYTTDGLPVVITKMRDLPLLHEKAIMLFGEDAHVLYGREKVDRYLADVNISDVVIMVNKKKAMISN